MDSVFLRAFEEFSCWYLMLCLRSIRETAICFQGMQHRLRGISQICCPDFALRLTIAITTRKRAAGLGQTG